MIERLATCSCGQLRVTTSGEPSKVSVCHCQACQRRTGSAFGVAAFFARDNITVEGRATTYSRPSDSGFDISFHFCPVCGSTVYWEPSRKPGQVALGIGAFADPDFPAPTQQVYTEHRHDWLMFSF
jgi:hypothetical protein